jgi:hypothetical protein
VRALQLHDPRSRRGVRRSDLLQRPLRHGGRSRGGAGPRRHPSRASRASPSYAGRRGRRGGATLDRSHGGGTALRDDLERIRLGLGGGACSTAPTSRRLPDLPLVRACRSLCRCITAGSMRVQDRIRLKNLFAAAEDRLIELGSSGQEAGRLLARACTLLEDGHEIWRHPAEGAGGLRLTRAASLVTGSGGIARTGGGRRALSHEAAAPVSRRRPALLCAGAQSEGGTAV